MTNQFDNIAKNYYSYTPRIPKAYTILLQNIFNIKPGDHIIDLGCGSGDLALDFAKKTSFVEGIDSSKVMIEMAKKNDKKNQVRWINDCADNFNFGKEKYQLIYSFEAFHLFPKQQSLIKKCANALKQSGALCIGWVMYAFDPPLKEVIERTFKSHGIPWDDWGIWTCPSFPTLVINANAGLTYIRKKSIKIKANVSTKDILAYFFSVSKTASLSNDLKRKISEDLWKEIVNIYPSGESNGYDTYSLMYCIKH